MDVPQVSFSFHKNAVANLQIQFFEDTQSAIGKRAKRTSIFLNTKGGKAWTVGLLEPGAGGQSLSDILQY